MYNKTMYKRLFKAANLHYINNVLALTVVVLALYIFVWPFLPALSWWTKYDAPVISHKPVTTVAANQPVPQQNTLIIPSLNMRQEVFDGPTQHTLSKGVWHLPGNSSPNIGGNTIMAAHRFTYSGKATFYYLDKINMSDPITLYWQGKRYDYIVTAINVVPPTNTSLITQTTDPTLTLYTCTPLWSAKDRLVITAKLAEVYP